MGIGIHRFVCHLLNISDSGYFSMWTILGKKLDTPSQIFASGYRRNTASICAMFISCIISDHGINVDTHIMNYYAARELKKDGIHSGLWHYTCMNDGNVWAVGYCSPWESCPNCKDAYPAESGCELCKGNGLVKSTNPCYGHATANEACQHYKSYLLDRLRIDGPKVEEWPKDKCAVDDCASEAKYFSTIPGDYHHYELCEMHANKETVSGLFNVGESWSS